MSTREKIQRTLDQIYNTAFDPEAFTNVSTIIADSVDALNAVVVISRDGVPNELSATTSAKAQQDYLDYYGRIDVWTPPPSAIKPFTISRSHELIADADVFNSEFYNDYARHLGMWHPIGSRCPLNHNDSLMIGINRPRMSRRFNRWEEAQLSDLTRHMQRALQLRRYVELLEQRAQIGFASLDRLAFAAVITDATGRLLYANAMAEEFAREGLGITLAGRRLACRSRRHDRDLSALVRDAAAGGSGGGMRINGPTGSDVILAIVTPLPRRLAERGEGHGYAFVGLRPAKGAAGFVQAVVGELFGMTRSEAEVAILINSGVSLEEISAVRGVKLSTVKSQLVAVLRKTETESQRDLVRLLGRLPQLR